MIGPGFVREAFAEQPTTLTRDEIQALVREAVREALAEERMHSLLATPVLQIARRAWCGVCGAFDCNQVHVTCGGAR